MKLNLQLAETTNDYRCVLHCAAERPFKLAKMLKQRISTQLVPSGEIGAECSGNDGTTPLDTNICCCGKTRTLVASAQKTNNKWCEDRFCANIATPVVEQEVKHVCEDILEVCNCPTKSAYEEVLRAAGEHGQHKHMCANIPEFENLSRGCKRACSHARGSTWKMAMVKFPDKQCAGGPDYTHGDAFGKCVDTTAAAAAEPDANEEQCVAQGHTWKDGVLQSPVCTCPSAAYYEENFKQNGPQALCSESLQFQNMTISCQIWCASLPEGAFKMTSYSEPVRTCGTYDNGGSPAKCSSMDVGISAVTTPTIAAGSLGGACVPSGSAATTNIASTNCCCEATLKVVVGKQKMSKRTCEN